MPGKISCSVCLEFCFLLLLLSKSHATLHAFLIVQKRCKKWEGAPTEKNGKGRHSIMFFEPRSDMWQPNRNTRVNWLEPLRSLTPSRSKCILFRGMILAILMSKLQQWCYSLPQWTPLGTRALGPGVAPTLCSQPWHFCPPSKCKERMTLPSPGLESSSL